MAENFCSAGMKTNFPRPEMLKTQLFNLACYMNSIKREILMNNLIPS
jgi:hypothetical protein